MNSNIFKKTGIVLLVLLFLLQFYQPARNEGMAKGENDISHSLAIPATIQQTLETSCYDCHSNHTVYPWYTRIQPVGLWMKDHIDEGKRELNFSEFNSYKTKRKLKKLKSIAEEIEEDEMPLGSYTFIHRYALLNETQKSEIIAWAKESQLKIIQDSIAKIEAVESHEENESHRDHE